MKKYMLDTNTVSYLIKSHPEVMQRVASQPMQTLCISSITEGELQFGLAKRPEATRLRHLIHEFLLRVDVLPWDSLVAKQYGTLRAHSEKNGKILSDLDLLIATHAVAVNAVLVTNDKSFTQLKSLKTEDWTKVV